MPGWKGIIAQTFTPETFDAYCHTLQWTAWRPSFMVLHNTATPSLVQRPNGFTQQHIFNLEAFYRDTQKWKAGPHLFIDDKQIWVFTPLTVSGTHSPSWNKGTLGIEMLGNYEHEPFDSGRGLAVQHHTVAALATLCAVLGIDPQTMRLHREDPLTTHACPGKHVRKLAVIQAVQELLVERHAGEHVVQPGV
jgi:N-acetylmuramoyl-L-alanine amidase